MHTLPFLPRLHAITTLGVVSVFAASMALCSIQVAIASPSNVVSSSVHSMSEFDYLIGTWQCLNTQAGKPATQSRVQFEWMYDKKALKETVNAAGYAGEFLTTLDKNSNTFKGVAVESPGSYVVWENSGMTSNTSSEVGYRFEHGQLHPVSRTDAERLNDTHYIIRDFGPDTASGKGQPTDTEDCRKRS